MQGKKAQVADTTTWVVATLITVVVLTIGIFATNFVKLDESVIFLDDKKKDFLATKSITSFLSKQENIDFLKNNDKEQVEIKMDKFLESLPKPDTFWFWLPNSNSASYKFGGYGGWNMELDQNSGKKLEIYHYKSVPSIILASNFEIIFDSDEIKLRFWAECAVDQCE